MKNRGSTDEGMINARAGGMQRCRLKVLKPQLPASQYPHPFLCNIVVSSHSTLGLACDLFWPMES